MEKNDKNNENLSIGHTYTFHTESNRLQTSLTLQKSQTSQNLDEIIKKNNLTGMKDLLRSRYGPSITELTPADLEKHEDC